MSIGFWEMAVIILAAIIFIKPEKAEEYSKTISSFLRGIKSAKNEAEEIVNEVKE